MRELEAVLAAHHLMTGVDNFEAVIAARVGAES